MHNRKQKSISRNWRAILIDSRFRFTSGKNQTTGPKNAFRPSQPGETIVKPEQSGNWSLFVHMAVRLRIQKTVLTNTSKQTFLRVMSKLIIQRFIMKLFASVLIRGYTVLASALV